MATREEIRLEIADILGKNWGDNWEVHNRVAKEITTYLHSQGVVLKVDRELPKLYEPLTATKEQNDMVRLGYNSCKQDMLRAGYVATEPLVDTAAKEPSAPQIKILTD